MSGEANILVVDDDPFMHEMYADALSEKYRLIAAEGGAAALQLAQTERPDVIVLDVEMPDMDGYEACRRLKVMDDTANIPVVFVSGHDQIGDRLRGYDAGGQDYVTKPFIPRELEAKVAFLLKAAAERAQIKGMADFATTTAMTAMTSMGEMGALLESLKKFNTCADYTSLADTVLDGLASYGLQGVVQVRSPDETITRNCQGDATPLEVSVMNHLVSMERIVQFKSRMSITYPCVTLLVNDMPVEDADRCGRLRDHLAMLLEGAEVRAQGITALFESTRRREVIERSIVHITETLQEIDSSQRRSRMETRLAFNELTDRFEHALARVALTQAQDEFLSDILRNGIEAIINAQSGESELQNKLTAIVNELKEMV